MVASRVAPDQRARRFDPCPICEGHDSMRRGRGERCKGYRSNDERFYFCSREEYAGALQPNANGDYRHRVDGQPCFCGHEHGAWMPPAMPKPKSEPRPVKARSGPLPRTIPDDDDEVLTLAAEYAYRRADGSLAYRVARYEYPLKPGETKPGKTFRQFQQIDSMSWAWGLGDAERVLYRLPEILAAPAHRPVFIVEGEKCAEALAALGLVATSCPEGAKKWVNVPGRHDALRGRPVVILGDQDKDGCEHAQQVATDLTGIAASVRVVNLPNLPAKGDAVEWIANGGTKDELYERAIATPAYDTAPAQEPREAQEAQEQDTREAELRAANIRMNTRLRWPERVNARPETHVRASEAKVAIALRHLVEVARHTPPEAGGATQVTLPELALAAGVSKGTASKAAAALAEMRAFRKIPFQVPDRHTGKPIDCNAYELGDLIDAPEEWVPPGGPRQPQGGMRQGAGAKPNTCRKCGGTQVQVTQQDWLVTEETTICPDCRDETHRQVGSRRPAGPQRIVETLNSKGFPLEYSRGNGVGDPEESSSIVEESSIRDDAPITPLRTSQRGQLGNGVGDSADVEVRPLPRASCGPVWIVENAPEIPTGVVLAPGVPLEEMCVDGHRHKWLPGDSRDRYECRVCRATKRRKVAS